MKRLLILVIICALFSDTANSQLPPECSLAPRLEIGSSARVLPANVMNLRQQPTTSSVIVSQIPAAGVFYVLDGSRCADGYNWWQVNYLGTMGWVAEGDSQGYWLETLTQATALRPVDFIDTAGCQVPPDDYTRVRIGSADFNARTLAMLDHAQALYAAQGGAINFRQAITQGAITMDLLPLALARMTAAVPLIFPCAAAQISAS